MGNNMRCAAILTGILSISQVAFANLPASNLVLWLTAGAGVENTNGASAAHSEFVGVWRDQSPNNFDAFPAGISGNPATLYNPTFVTNAINGKPAVNFVLGPGGLEYARLQLPTPLLTGTADFHVFAVVKYSPVNPNGEKIIGANYGVTNTGGLEFYSHQQTQKVYKGGALIGTNNVQDGLWHLYEARRVGNTVSIWIDNKLDASGTLASAIASNINWTIGNAGDYASGPLGLMAEQIVYNNTLSSNDINQVVRRMADNYNLAIIPEPSAVALLGAGAWLLMARRRRA